MCLKITRQTLPDEIFFYIFLIPVLYMLKYYMLIYMLMCDCAYYQVCLLFVIRYRLNKPMMEIKEIFL